MKTKYLAIASGCVVLACSASVRIVAQAPSSDRMKDSMKNDVFVKDNQPRKISDADKAAIKEIFKDVDPKAYRLEFGGGKDVAGAKKISMTQVRQVSRIRTSPDTKADVICLDADGVLYVVACAKSAPNLKGLLGHEKMARLNQIVAKYSPKSVQ